MGPLGQAAQQQQVGPMDVVGDDQMAQLRNAMMTRAGQAVMAGPLPSQSPEEVDAIRQYMESMQKPVDPSLKWWQMAAGFLSPTKTGTSGEGLGLGIAGYTKGLEAEQLANRNAQNAALLFQAQQAGVRGKQSRDLYEKEEKRIWDYMEKQDAKRISDRDVTNRVSAIYNSNLVGIRDALKTQYGLTPEEVARRAPRMAMEETLRALPSMGYDPNTIDRLRAQFEKDYGSPMAPPTTGDPVGGASNAPPPVDQPGNGGDTMTVDTDNAGKDNVRTKNMSKGLFLSADEDSQRAIIAALPPQQQLQALRWLKQGQAAAAMGNNLLAGKRERQLGALTRGEQIVNLEGDKKRAERQAEIETAAQLAGQGESAKGTVKAIDEGYEALKGSPVQIARLNSAMEEWYKSRDTFGTGAELLNKTRSFLSNRLGLPIDKDLIASPQAFQSAMTPLAAQLTRQTDAQPAQAQVEQIRMAIGNIENDPNVVPKILHSLHKLAEIGAAEHNRLYSSAVRNKLWGGADKSIKVPPVITKMARNAKGELWAKMSDGSERKLSGGLNER